MAASALASREDQRKEFSESPSDPVASARAAGLRHVDDHRLGLHRGSTGKKNPRGRGRLVANFVIRDAGGQVVRDRETLDRIRRLAIPPAWREVWICPLAEGHLQATGRDARGRKQYRYHPRWREARDGTKYSRMSALGSALPGLRRRVAADLRLPGLPRSKVLATVVRLLETTLIRVGNDEYARTNRSFGLTTLKDRHVELGRSTVRFHFRGKSRVFHQISVHDPAIARIVRRCRDLPGQGLFQYVGADGSPVAIDSADVNGYIREATGQDFTAKDFRTWAGTVLAAATLAETARSARGTRRNGLPIGPTKRDVVRAIARVAEQLGNTPAVCRKSYIHPEVVASFFDGTLAPALPRRASPPQPSGGSPAGLRPEERAVLALLRRRAHDQSGPSPLARQLRRSLRLVRRPPRSTRAGTIRRNPSHPGGAP